MASLTYLEKIMTKPFINEDVEIPSDPVTKDQVKISWDLINKSTSNYALLLQKYDISEVVKSFIKRYGQSKKFSSLPKAGNIDVSDSELNYRRFYGAMERIKEKRGNRTTFKESETEELKTECHKIVQYVLTGKHEDQRKRFVGWQSAFKNAKKNRKEVLVGILSVDVPHAVRSKHNVEYEDSGGQHYTAFAYEMKSKELYLFDSSTTDPVKDGSENYFILKFVFDELEGQEVKVTGLRYRNTLQPGAGNEKGETYYSYNNQNVFCHTWSLWFSILFIVFYKSNKKDVFINFLQSLSHRNPLLNLAMIKRFAGWLTTFLIDEEDEEEMSKAKFPLKLYNKHVENGDKVKVATVKSNLTQNYHYIKTSQYLLYRILSLVMNFQVKI